MLVVGIAIHIEETCAFTGKPQIRIVSTLSRSYGGALVCFIVLSSVSEQAPSRIQRSLRSYALMNFLLKCVMRCPAMFSAPEGIVYSLG